VAGGAYANLFGLPAFGFAGVAAVSMGLRPDIELTVGAAYARTSTSNGLAVNEVSGDASLEGVPGRFRFGGGLGLAHLWIPRVSEPNASLKTTGMDFFMTFSIDVLRTGEHEALFVALRPELDVLAATLFRCSLGVGYRL
jgi:hypothetical protein